MKKILLISLVVILMAPMKANAFSWSNFFRSLFGITTEATSDMKTIKGDVNSQLKDFAKQANSLDKNVQSSFLAIVEKVSSESDYKAIKEKLTDANSKSTESEKVTAVNKVYSDYTKTLSNNKVSVLLILKLLDNNEKTTFISNVKILSNDGEKYFNLSEQCLSLKNNFLQNTTSNDDRTATINEIDTAMNQYASTSKTVLALATQLKIFGSLAGMKF